MGRPIQITADELINALSSSTGVVASGTGASLTTGTITLPDGSTGTRCKAIGGSGQNLFVTITIGNILVTKRGIFFRVFLDAPDTADPATIYSGYVRVRNAGASEQFQAILAFRPGWNEFRIGRNKFTQVVGTTAWDSITWDNVILKVDAVTSTVLTVYLDGLSYAGYARPQIPIIFDDGYTEVIDNAFPYMAARNMIGTVAVISSKVGASGFMTLAQLRTLHDAGWAMVDHTELHTATSGSPANWLQAASEETCYQQIKNCQQYLASVGFTRDQEHLMFCSPYGEWSTNYKAAADRAGCLMFCTLAAADPAQPQSTPFASAYPNSRYVPRISTVSTWTVAQMKAYIDAMIGSGTSAPLLFHKPKSGASTSIETELANFKEVIDHLHRKRGMADYPTLPQFYYRTLTPTI